MSFLSSYFRNKSDSELIRIALKMPDGSFENYYFDDPVEAEEYGLSKADSANVFFGVLPYSVPEPKVSAVNRGWVVWTDIDAKDNGNLTPEELYEKNVQRRFILPPTYTIVSGHGIHCHWFVPPTDDVSKLLKASKQIGSRVAGDSVADAIRLLRLPGTYNLKYPEAPPAYILDSYVSEYDLEDLFSCLKKGLVDEDLVNLIRTGDWQSSGHDSRSERDWFVLRKLVENNISEDSIYWIMENLPVGDRYREDKDLRRLRHDLDKLASQGIVTLQAVDNDFGIIQKGYGMYHRKKDGQLIKLTTFAIVPELLLEGDLSKGQIDAFQVSIFTEDGEYYGIPLSSADFNKADTLNKSLKKAGWQFLSNDTMARQLCQYLLFKLREIGQGTVPSKTYVETVGRHGDHFVTHEMTLGPDESIVFRDMEREFPRVFLTFEMNEALVALQDFVKYYFDINEKYVVWLALGFYSASLHKSVLNAEEIPFPFLNLFGTRGSGKTTMISVLQKIVGYRQLTTYDANTTFFMLMSLWASSNSIPISLSEFRTNIRSYDIIVRHILLAYNMGWGTRGRPDQTHVRYPLSAPITLDGEDGLTEAAVRDRVVQLKLYPETIKEGTKANKSFKELMSVDIRQFAGPLVQFSLTYQDDFQDSLDLLYEVVPQPISERVRKNMAVVVYGIKMFQAFCREMGVVLPDFEWVDILIPPIKNVVNMSTGRTRLDVDEFVEDLFIAYTQSNDNMTLPFPIKYDPTSGELWFQVKGALNWWYRQMRQVGKLVRGEDALRSMLDERLMKDDGDDLKNGNYILGPKKKSINGATWHAYGINIQAAHNCGLDVPEKILEITGIIKLRKS